MEMFRRYGEEEEESRDRSDERLNDYQQAQMILEDLRRPLKLTPEVSRRVEEKEEARRVDRDRSLPRDRKCPICRRTVLESNRWVIAKVGKRKYISCRACSQVESAPDWWIADAKCFEREGRWIVQRGVLTDKILHSMQLDTLHTPGWSRSKCSKIRAGDHSISEKEKVILEELCKLEKLEVVFEDRSIWRDKGKQIHYLRRIAGISLRVFAELLEWHLDRLRRIEAGGSMKGKDLALLLKTLVDIT